MKRERAAYKVSLKNQQAALKSVAFVAILSICKNIYDNRTIILDVLSKFHSKI